MRPYRGGRQSGSPSSCPGYTVASGHDATEPLLHRGGVNAPRRDAS